MTQDAITSQTKRYDSGAETPSSLPRSAAPLPHHGCRHFPETVLRMACKKSGLPWILRTENFRESESGNRRGKTWRNRMHHRVLIFALVRSAHLHQTPLPYRILSVSLFTSFTIPFRDCSLSYTPDNSSAHGHCRGNRIIIEVGSALSVTLTSLAFLEKSLSLHFKFHLPHIPHPFCSGQKRYAHGAFYHTFRKEQGFDRKRRYGPSPQNFVLIIFQIFSLSLSFTQIPRVQYSAKTRIPTMHILPHVERKNPATQRPDSFLPI